MFSLNKVPFEGHVDIRPQTGMWFLKIHLWDLIVSYRYSLFDANWNRRTNQTEKSIIVSKDSIHVIYYQK